MSVSNPAEMASVVHDTSSEFGIHNTVLKMIQQDRYVGLEMIMPDYAIMLANLVDSLGGRANIQRVRPTSKEEFAFCLRYLSTAIVAHHPSLRASWSQYTQFLLDLCDVITPAGVFRVDMTIRRDKVSATLQIPAGAVPPFPIKSSDFTQVDFTTPYSQLLADYIGPDYEKS